MRPLWLAAVPALAFGLACMGEVQVDPTLPADPSAAPAAPGEPAPPAAPAAPAPGGGAITRAELSAAGRWLQASDHEGRRVVKQWCHAEPQSLALGAEGLILGYGQDAEVFPTVTDRVEGDVLVLEYKHDMSSGTGRITRLGGAIQVTLSTADGPKDFVPESNPGIPVMTQCCSSTEDEPLGPEYAWVEAPNPCPPAP